MVKPMNHSNDESRPTVTVEGSKPSEKNKPGLSLKGEGKYHRIRWAIISVIALVLGFCVGGYISVMNDLPPTESISFFTPPVSTKVFDDNNNLVTEFFIERRELTNLSEVPEYLKNGFICIEDKQFYKHWGINLYSLLRSMIINILQMKVVRGGSTITMQLARNMFLTQEQTILRKLKEIALAIRLEKTYTKDEILEKYLNQVNFGQGRYGVATAARYYFNKDISKLSLTECALLIALPKSPESYSPYKYSKRAMERRNLVLKTMFKNNLITEKQYEKTIKEPLNVVIHKDEKVVGEYFLEEIRRYLELKYGSEFLYRSGANIYTTLDVKMQKISEGILEKHLSRLEKDYHLSHPKSKTDSTGLNDTLNGVPYLQGALVMVDHHTGEVKAMVGGRDFFRSKFNRATQAHRQTGSAFKVFVFAAAIDNGFTPADIVLDLPIVLEIPGADSIYRPANYDHKFLGPITLRKALALSRNLAAIRLIRSLGPDLVVKYAHNLGIKSPLLPVVSLALGSCETTLLELTHAISTIANLGEKVQPTMIRKITDKDGTIIEKNDLTAEQRLSPQVSYVMINTMRAVVDYGTGYEIRRYYKGPAAGKTGTTNNYSDAWFIGFTPTYTLGIWVGYDNNNRIFTGATGGIVSAPIWGEIIAKIDTLKNEEFTVPSGLISCKVCAKTGLLAISACPDPREEIFIEGTEPKQSCDAHSFENIMEYEKEFEKLDRAAIQGY